MPSVYLNIQIYSTVVSIFLSVCFPQVTLYPLNTQQHLPTAQLKEEIEYLNKSLSSFDFSYSCSVCVCLYDVLGMYCMMFM